MLTRGVLAAVVIAAGVILSARVVIDEGAGEPAGRRDGGTQAPASLSVGAPAAATSVDAPAVATLQALLPNRPPNKPDDTSVAAPQPADEPTAAPDRRHTARLKKGGTLTGLLIKAGVGADDAHAAAQALGEFFNLRRMRAGQEVSLTFKSDPNSDGTDHFHSFSVNPDYQRTITVARAAEGGFRATERAVALQRSTVGTAGIIRRSLFVDGAKAGVPVPVLVDLIRAYSWDVDFQRDIQPGDAFEVMYERFADDNGSLVHTGEIVYAALTLSGIRYPLYRHATPDGETAYFNDKGLSARKALMRTPIDGARLSSRFGKRRHPILGYTKMHRGADFAAPRGTPIYAAGDGRVVEAGRNGAYGKYVRLRHNAEYATAYAHMSRIAKGARKGRRVKQGQVIGYVGSTGRSTGAHLHYEIIKGGRRTNPLKVRMPSGRTLTGLELDLFLATLKQIDRAYADLGRSGGSRRPPPAARRHQ